MDQPFPLRAHADVGGEVIGRAEADIPAPQLGLLRPYRCHGEREPRGGERADEPYSIHLISFLGSMRTTVQATSARPISGNNTRLTQPSSSAISAIVVERCGSA